MLNCFDLIYLKEFMKYLQLLALASLLLIACKSNSTGSDEEMNVLKAAFPCVDGLAEDIFPCNNVDLMARISRSDLLGPDQSLNDIWGWTDPQTDKEYALVGLTDGVTFVDISSPNSPVVVGKLEEVLNSSKVMNDSIHDDNDNDGKGASAWRDIKVFNNYAFIVSDNQPHGLQIFDLTKLRTATDLPVSFTEDQHYSAFGKAHNIAINEETGFAYVVGSNTYGGGLHIIDINDPFNPVFAGFHSDSTVGFDNTGYIHDTQCLNYSGPDSEYQNKELCFNSSETHLVIADVSDKQNTATISKVDYQGRAYAHQGWLTEDHRYFILDDEIDAGNTTTYIFDVQDLDNPQMIGTYVVSSISIDHNQYVKGNKLYQANYTSGLRILNLDNIQNANLSEIGFFDTYPVNNSRSFNGAWSNYPFFENGLVIVSDISNGLFILKPNL